MPTEATIWPKVPAALIAIGLVLLVAAIAVREGQPPAFGASPAALPSGLVPRGTFVEADPAGKVSREFALVVARDQIGPQFDSAVVEAYLVEVTDPMTAGLDHRAVWLIRVTGISLAVPGPPLLDAPPRRATVAYVYVDAVTGEWLTTSMAF